MLRFWFCYFFPCTEAELCRACTSRSTWQVDINSNDRQEEWTKAGWSLAALVRLTVFLGKQMWAHLSAVKFENWMGCKRGWWRTFFFFNILEPLQKRKTVCLDQINDPPSLTSIQEQMLRGVQIQGNMQCSFFPASSPSMDKRVSKRRLIVLYLLPINDFSSRILSNCFVKQCNLLTVTSAARNFCYPVCEKLPLPGF